MYFTILNSRYTFLDTDFGRTKIPLTHGVELRVILAGIASGTARSVIETPLEYAKVRLERFLSFESSNRIS